MDNLAEWEKERDAFLIKIGQTPEVKAKPTTKKDEE